ncbi:fasciclin domain-containing protein [Mucilaginibacter sp. HMF5004]|uniref:fasciclin domain-containing protein n=1 Tax=Mucilaginibacter rivuli TaxID=2857527 RepID=UPI001C5CF58A|nr:fasciclin domain-containing protein [Mucilaginibacter rivuli]MBW4889953.1 fasciclin domain-containing protein [Mucilaginibacter rivuli]
MERNFKKPMAYVLFVSVLLICAWGCVKESIKHTTSDTVNITQYFENNADQFSELSKILNISGTASYLKAYGSYTFFAPTNSAIKLYLKDIGKNAVEDVSAADWKDFVRFHLLQDSIPVSRFTDGKLPNLTMYGQYLITGAVNTSGVTKIWVNRQAYIITPNISVGNGLIHTIDHVLIPARLTLAKTIEANPKYSIFTQIMKATTLYDTLNIVPANNPDSAKRWLTVIAQTDSVFNLAGFSSYASVLAKYSNTGNPKLTTDSLHLFMDNHIIYGAKYLADIIVDNAQPTLAPSQVLTTKLSGQTVLINDDNFNGVYEPGFILNRPLSDISASNGVLHDASKNFIIKVRYPYAVFFDVCAIPDIMKNTAVYKKANYIYLTDTEIKAIADIKFSGAISTNTANTPQYLYGTSAGTSKTSYNIDVLKVPLSVSGSYPLWVEFRTPLLVRGQYKVWVGYFAQQQSTSNGGTSCEVAASMGLDGTADRFPLANARTLNFITKRPGINKTVNGVSVIDFEAEEAIGYKTYMASTAGAQVARLMGIVNVTTTGRYWFRLTAINGTQTTNNIDMLQFIPVNANQQNPKFNPDGSIIP